MYFFSDALYESPYNNLHKCVELHRTVPIATQVISWSQCAAKFLAENLLSNAFNYSYAWA